MLLLCANSFMQVVHAEANALLNKNQAHVTGAVSVWCPTAALVNGAHDAMLAEPQAFLRFCSVYVCVCCSSSLTRDGFVLEAAAGKLFKVFVCMFPPLCRP